jgi:5-methylcytosine-specific restriction protein A
VTTYLLTWNPKRFGWDDLHEDIGALQTEGFLLGRWSCGVTRRIAEADRLFLIRLGIEPRGIMASGWALGAPFEDEHWHPHPRPDGRIALYVEVCFDAILDPETQILSLETIRERVDRRMNWTPQASGVSIPEQAAVRLEKEWERVLARRETGQGLRIHDRPEPDGVYTEGAVRRVTGDRFERNRAARAVCIQRHGLSCSVCGFDFQERYGEIGAGFIHVHHLIPLSETQQERVLHPVDDLRPVCPNCHEMLHRRHPPYTLEELSLLLRPVGGS